MVSLLTPGLVSVTFRKLNKEQIVNLMVQNGLRSVEWGGDIHVPLGDLTEAAAAKHICAENGITISAYGSYYHMGTSADFLSVLDTALALGAPMIRVWAGEKGSAPSDPDNFKRICDHACALCEQAEAAHIKLSMEYHGNTLTDTLESTLAVLAHTPDTLLCHWQPPVGSLKEGNLTALKTVQIAHRLGNIHCFAWEAKDGAVIRHPLTCYAEDWTAYLSAVQQPCHVSLEFVKNDSEHQLTADARTLLEILNSI